MSESIILKLSLESDTDIMELSIIDETIEGSRAHQLLYPLAVGIGVILEDDPGLLYDAGTELYNNDAYVEMESNTQH